MSARNLPELHVLYLYLPLSINFSVCVCVFTFGAPAAGCLLDCQAVLVRCSGVVVNAKKTK
jgi:hypothetical protein